MIPLPVRELEGLGRLEPAAEEVTGVQIDSRRIGPGDLFVAVRGGVDYLEEARKAGAAATLVPDDDFAAMAAIGRAVRDRSSADVVGITGSTGKTSTKDILAALVRPHRRTVAAEASYNAELGVPLTLARLEPDTEVLIAELAMRGFGQIRDLCEIARPDARRDHRGRPRPPRVRRRRSRRGTGEGRADRGAPAWSGRRGPGRRSASSSHTSATI